MFTRVIGLVATLAVLIGTTFLIEMPANPMSIFVVDGMFGQSEDDTENDEIKIKIAPQDLAETAWMLLLVNDQHPVPQGYTPDLSQLDNGLYFDARAIEYLNAMINAARAQGLAPIVVSAYRTIERQSRLFMDKVITLMEEGYTREQAEAITKTTIAYPGHSEHQTGLAVDIAPAYFPYLEEEVAETPEIKWLMENCAKYGFILRYPKGKEEITGIAYEPWHFRYVGFEAAQEIMARGITLEEYWMERETMRRP